MVRPVTGGSQGLFQVQRVLPPGARRTSSHGDARPRPGRAVVTLLALLALAGGCSGASDQGQQDLLSTEGAGEEPAAWRFVNDIDSDQRIEMDRIQVLLAEIDGQEG